MVQQRPEGLGGTSSLGGGESLLGEDGQGRTCESKSIILKVLIDAPCIVYRACDEKNLYQWSHCGATGVVQYMATTPRTV